MPLLRPTPHTDLLRFWLIVAGVLVPCSPGIGQDVKLAGEPTEAPCFDFREKLSGPLIFSGDDYALLSGIENSADRCLPIGLLLQGRAYPGAPWGNLYQGIFTCAEQGSVWNRDRCTFSVTPTTDDAYRILLENWETEINLLDIPDAGPTRRRTVTATLATLTTGTFVEFLRIDANDQSDYVGVDGWAIFLRNTSWISGTLSQLGTRSRDVLLFRYRLKDQPMILEVGGTYKPVDKSGTGWQVLLNTENSGVTPHTIDYVKTPAISGFKPYTIGTYNDWHDPLNPGRTSRYGVSLLLLPCYEAPADYGYNTADYLKLTGTGGNGGGPSLGGAVTDGGPCLNVRRNVGNTSNDKSLWWKFGDFTFGRCFPLADAIRFALTRLAAPIVAGVQQPADPGLNALVPPTNALLSLFYTANTNPATGETGAANEVPRLVVSAGSDVKRYGASEAATRLMISPKTLITEACALHDAVWFIDPTTGYLRMEHRAYAENQYGTGPVRDLRTIPDAILPAIYTTRQEQLPRFEELTIAGAQTVSTARLTGPTGLLNEVNFASGLIDYGTGGCTNNRTGQNKTVVSVSRLSGDVAAMVLSGEAIADNILAILAPDPNSQLSDANRALSASRLVQRYYRYGRSALSGTANGLPVDFLSAKPQREQAGISLALCFADGLTPTARLTTTLGPNGRLAKREVNLITGVTTAAAWLPIPATAIPAVLPTGRQFDNSFDRSFW